MTRQGADEMRVRHFLRALDARPVGHAHHTPQGTVMTDRPIHPTRIIPAGAPLPDRGPLPGELPSWYAAPRPAGTARTPASARHSGRSGA